MLDGLPLPENPARGRLIETRNESQERAFAATAGADQARDGAGGNAEIHPVERAKVPIVGARHMVNLEMEGRGDHGV